ncbi:MAG: glycosyltransferase [Bacteroidota bacterium]
MRKRNLEAVLAIPSQVRGQRNLPEWEDVHLQNDYPGWIVKFSDFFLPYIYPGFQLRKLAGKFDLIMTAGEYIIPSLILSKPVVIFPVGGDMTRLPFGSKSLKQEIHSWLFRKRIHNVNRIITEQEDIVWASKLLGQRNKIIRFPFLVDVYQLQENVNHNLKNELKNRYSSLDGIVFHPTRKNLDPARIDYKGNDKLLRAFKKFRHDYPEKQISMISGLHGRHVNQYKEMVQKLGMEEYVEFIDHLSLPDLHAYMALDRVAVFDQFTHNLNTLSGIQREALAFGKPVVSSTETNSQEFVEAYGTECPVWSAFNEEQIYDCMVEIFNQSSDERRVLHNIAILWVKKYLHWENRIDELIGILKRTLES